MISENCIISNSGYLYIPLIIISLDFGIIILTVTYQIDLVKLCKVHQLKYILIVY